MRLKKSTSKNSISYYAIKSFYNNGKNTSKIVHKFGTHDELSQKLKGQDPETWVMAQIVKMNEQEDAEKQDIMVKFSPTKSITKGEQRLFNGGYLFLQKIYNELELGNICSQLAQKYKFTFDLDSVLSRLVYSRIIYPSSKLATCEMCKNFLEQPQFQLQHIYRALEIMAKESDYLQAQLYKNSLKITDRNTRILYYDCTNFFFEIEQESGLRQYGISKEHRPNPIVQMGLFMDGDGIPLAFDINNGNTNEQVTMKPLEQQILSDFECSRFIVCTDAGLSSKTNRQFNNLGDRAFVTTQSVKQLKKHLKDWALDNSNWSLAGSQTAYDLSQIDEKDYADRIFYKERWINENGLEQKLIVTYSIKHKNYQRKIRTEQINQAARSIENASAKIDQHGQNDYKRFIKKTGLTKDGEIADRSKYYLDESRIAQEEIYDGFYAVCTNLDGSSTDIIKINQRRWEIEECFRIMKSEFKARPVFLSRDDRIQAHFMTCFIALIIFRLLEQRLDEKYTCRDIIQGLREMNFLELKGDGFIPAYTRTDFTDAMHEAFGFRTDFQLITHKEIRNIYRKTKK
jgi:transposase